MSASSITVKAFLELPDASIETRRFVVEKASLVQAGAYQQIHEKIGGLFPDLKGMTFSLYWKDSDGDKITFSSAEEMKEALTFVDGVFRIFISVLKKSPTSKAQEPPKADQPTSAGSQKPQQGSTSSSSTSSSSQSQAPFDAEYVHPHVECDGCNGRVKGIRYKCCVCPDFDLCTPCEAKGMHTEHDMYKIPPPQNGNPPQNSNPFGFLPPNIAQYIHVGAHNAAHAAASAAAAATNSFRGGPNPTPPPPPPTGFCGPQPTPQGSHDDYLKSVGANIAAFLDPFGIDVTYDVHQNGQEQQQQQQQQGRCGRGRGFWQGQGGRGCSAWKNMEKRAATSTGKPANKTAEAQTDCNEKNKKDCGVNPMESGDAPQHTPTKTTASGSNEAMDTDQKEKSASPVSDEWTFVPDDGSEVHVPNPTTAIPMPAPAIPMPAPPTVPTPTPPQENVSATASSQNAGGIYPDLRLQQSLDQMLAMGFTNTDSWLSDLLIDNKCDIGQTLDAIKAKATQQLHTFRK